MSSWSWRVLLIYFAGARRPSARARLSNQPVPTTCTRRTTDRRPESLSVAVTCHSVCVTHALANSKSDSSWLQCALHVTVTIYRYFFLSVSHPAVCHHAPLPLFQLVPASCVNPDVSLWQPPGARATTPVSGTLLCSRPAHSLLAPCRATDTVFLPFLLTRARMTPRRRSPSACPLTTIQLRWRPLTCVAPSCWPAARSFARALVDVLQSCKRRCNHANTPNLTPLNRTPTMRSVVRPLPRPRCVGVVPQRAMARNTLL